MKFSLQTKFLMICIFLVSLTASGISVTYYFLTKRSAHRESQQRIQIGFKIILDDFANQLETYTKRFAEFLQEDAALGRIADIHNQALSKNQNTEDKYHNILMSTYLKRGADGLKKFGSVISAHRLALYGEDNRLLEVYQHDDERETVGGYVISETGNNAYLALDDPAQFNPILAGTTPIPDAPLPSGIAASYEGDIPETITIGVVSEGQKVGIRIVAPLYYQKIRTGVFVGEIFYTQRVVERYAVLSKTDVNFFAENQFSVGTLVAQTQIEPNAMQSSVPCQDLLTRTKEIGIALLTVGKQRYYQGQCGFHGAQGKVLGGITVSLSQEIENQESRKVLIAVLAISGIAIGAAFGLSLLFSRSTIRSIHNIVSVIGAAAGGDLRQTTPVLSQDEFGMLAVKLNQMITQLRTISEQVQRASSAVSGTADTIFGQMESLIHHMEQQAGSVDHTTGSFDKITQFIDVVARNTEDLLATASQILSSIQETRASIEEVTKSTGALTTNLHLISSSVDQVNHVVTQISDNTGQLEDVARQTETEIQHIDHSLQDVSANAAQAQQLAKETMDAATSGQLSVTASMQSMTELKAVASNTAQIMQKVNTWGQRVSSILGIVDEITEQTSLLALNASIISAQAGEHGRGFGVVAEEIKDLATRTKSSTKEIGTLMHELRKNTEDGVKNTTEGIVKAEQGMHLARAVQDALDAILDRATRSSTRAADTAQVIQQTAASSQMISTSISRVTEMVSNNRKAIQLQKQDIEQVVAAVENLSGMSEQVNRASVEQKHAANQITTSMEDAIVKFTDISAQTDELKHSAAQIVAAMHTIETTTEQIFHNATALSQETVKHLVQQADGLQHIVNVFKIS